VLIIEVGCGSTVHGLEAETRLLMSEHPYSGLKHAALLRIQPDLPQLQQLHSIPVSDVKPAGDAVSVTPGASFLIFDIFDKKNNHLLCMIFVSLDLQMIHIPSSAKAGLSFLYQLQAQEAKDDAEAFGVASAPCQT
jgi:hypothetical protein